MNATEQDRPDPDALLGKLNQETEKEKRGRLKIFFGSCAGVGKTYAMLTEAKSEKEKGIDVVIGLVETHGRKDTEALIFGLPTIAYRSINYKGTVLKEFDIDAALKRKPTIILVDELAHSNASECRHRKRWQDVEELLAAGIHVFTTLNVQHLETLNDVVGQITGIRVWETIPDHVFDEADEVRIVDLPPDDLLQRLHDGKVYLPEQVKHAAQNFFRKGNLIALRELALRRTADRVDLQMCDYKLEESIQETWHTKERIMVCIGPHKGGEKLVRSAARLAASLKADWVAVYVETPSLQRLSASTREATFKTLKLAASLGAETKTLSGTHLTDTLLDYARSLNISKLIIGPSTPTLLERIIRTPSLADEITKKAYDLDLYIVGQTDETQDEGVNRIDQNFELSDIKDTTLPTSKIGYLLAIIVCGLITLVSTKIMVVFDLANLMMIYLIGVVFVAIRYGRGPSILVSILSVLSFNLFLIPPGASFLISNTQYLLTLLIMTGVALLVSNLTATLHYQARIAILRERRTSALYAMTKELSGALTITQIIHISAQHLSSLFQAKIALLLPDNLEKIRQIIDEQPVESLLKDINMGIAQWVYDNNQTAGMGTNTLPGSPALYLPLHAPMRIRGVLAVSPLKARRVILQPEQRQLLDTFSSQIALAIERVHYLEVAQEALVSMQSEQLRNSILSALSHALRTPLTSITNSSKQLVEDVAKPCLDRKDLAESIHENALQMTGLVSNLLDMARLQNGGVQLNKQWQALSQVLSKALKTVGRLLRNHQIEVLIPPHISPISIDTILIERVLYNLLENAAKHTPPGSHILITAEEAGDYMNIAIEDNGPGLPPGMEEKVFEKFIRGAAESSQFGVGLGLSICRSIIEAHEGKIWATNIPGKGARFTFSLPLKAADDDEN